MCAYALTTGKIWKRCGREEVHACVDQHDNIVLEVVLEEEEEEEEPSHVVGVE